MSTRIKTSISISVVFYDTPVEQLENLLDSFLGSIRRLRQVYDLSVIQIYMIDNSECEPLDTKVLKAGRLGLESQKIKLTYLHGHGNIGYGAAHNLILKNLDSRFHLMLNPDILIEEDGLLESFNILSADSSIALLSPNAADFSGKKQYLCKRYPSIFILLLRGFFTSNLARLFTRKLARYEMRDLSEVTFSKGIPLVSGCFMLIRTKTFIKINGFDKGYFLYFEDFDLSLRAAKFGELVFAPQVNIRHGGGNASKKGLRHIYYFIRSGIKFFNTHGWSFF
ncbi:MAG: glycosyltransferase family 2 protein [Gammaproteobacteria bacterium]|nr:glycosyltransferase family 2 protein [Gammaproteobacteria bacterium]